MEKLCDWASAEAFTGTEVKNARDYPSRVFDARTEVLAGSTETQGSRSEGPACTAVGGCVDPGMSLTEAAVAYSYAVCSGSSRSFSTGPTRPLNFVSTSRG